MIAALPDCASAPRDSIMGAGKAAFDRLHGAAQAVRARNEDEVQVVRHDGEGEQEEAECGANLVDDSEKKFAGGCRCKERPPLPDV